MLEISETLGMYVGFKVPCVIVPVPLVTSHCSVLKWFADRADRILLLFDAHKLDISDEFKLSIEALKGNDDKIRIVLNKVSYQSIPE